MGNRREFVKRSLLAGGALSMGGIPLLSRIGDAADLARVPKAPRAMRILVLGGTGFTGPHQVRYAVARGHEVTVFNRGRRQADLPASVVHLQGDRNTADLKSLENGKWDIVIDVPTTLPFWVRDAASALQNSADHYVFISTISVYADVSKPGMDENTPVLQYEGPDAMAETQQTAGRLYGQLKALSEKEAEKWFPGRTTVIRPGLIVGPGDTSGRFTHWPVRIDRGGEVLAPNSPQDPAQIIDVRDLAEWIIRMAETKTTGIYNATGPATPLTMGTMLDGIKAALNSSATFTWVPADFLEQHEVRGWSHMPVWVRPRDDNAGFARVSVQRAIDKGLTFRPLPDTAQATVQWFKGESAERQVQLLGNSIKPEKEAEVLAAWRAARG